MSEHFLELEELYGKSQRSTKVVGLPLMKLNDSFQFKDGKKRKLLHIEYRNMCVDLLRFDDGVELFTDAIYDNVIFRKEGSGDKK